jgi:hypothetical protein
MTFFDSPMNFTFYLSNCMICVELLVEVAFNILQTDYGITFDDAIESMI